MSNVTVFLQMSEAQKNSSRHSRYQRHDKKADDPNSVWHYFYIEIPARETAKCMKCDKILKTHSGSTGGLLSHLEKHQINLRKVAKAVLAHQ